MSAQENEKIAESRNIDSRNVDPRNVDSRNIDSRNSESRENGSSDSRRDVAMERLLSHRAGSIGSPATPCPDAEILAAYIDKGLAENEAARWEIHFATCERCQDILSALAISAPAEELQPQLAAATAAPAAQSAQKQTPTRGAESAAIINSMRSQKSYWVVGFAAAAALAAYFVVFRGRPEAPNSQPSPTQVATQNQNQSPIQNQPAAPASTAGASSNGYVPVPQSANSNLPKTNKKAGVTSDRPVNLQDATRENPIPLTPVVSSDQGGVVGGNVPAATQTAAGGATAGVGGGVRSRAAAQESRSMSAAKSAAPAEARVAPAGAPQSPNSVSAQNLDDAVAAAQGQEKTQQPAAGKTVGSFLSKKDPTSPSDLSAVLIFTGQGTSLWSVGQDGRIEKSNDSGNTWQHQQSGVNSQLLAGSAPNELVCWVVGRNSVILRTTDGGATWTKIPNPQALNGASVDWVGVFATDALHARISSVDSKRFSTADGGQTWTPVTP